MPFIQFGPINAENLVSKLESKKEKMVQALAETMTHLMIRLQEKAQARVKGRVAESIRDPRAEVNGSLVTGKLTWGGDPTTVEYKGGKPYDIARIIEEGTKDQWAINPLRLDEIAHTKQGRARGKLIKQGGIENRALANREFDFGPVAYVFHKKIVGIHFMSGSLQEMKAEIQQEIKKTLYGVLQGNI